MTGAVWLASDFTDESGCEVEDATIGTKHDWTEIEMIASVKVAETRVWECESAR